MNNAMITLASQFLHEIKGFEYNQHGKLECEPNYKIQVMSDIGEILAGKSVTAQQMKELFNEEKSNPNKSLFYKPCHILDSHGVTYKRKSFKDPSNLIIPGQFYYHPKLQVVPPAPVLTILDDGTITGSYESEEFYLEMIDKITMSFEI